MGKASLPYLQPVLGRERNLGLEKASWGRPCMAHSFFLACYHLGKPMEGLGGGEEGVIHPDRNNQEQRCSWMPDSEEPEIKF